MLNKKGLSPLIATILLIAFAVALGSVVMSVGKAIGKSSFSAGCGVFVDLEIVKISDKQKICISGSDIDLTIQNGPNIAVENLHISVIGSRSVYNYDSKVKLNKGDAQHIVFSYDKLTYGDIDKIIITPLIAKEDEIVMCKNDRLEIENIESCS